MSFLTINPNSYAELLDNKISKNIRIRTNHCYWDHDEEKWFYFDHILKNGGLK